MKRLILSFIIIILLSGCNNKVLENNKKDSIKFMEEYTELNGKKTTYDDNTYRELSINKDNPIIYKSPKDILEMIDEKETFAIYFGFADCPWCRSIISTLLDVSNDLELDTIYYVNIKDIRDVLEIDSNGNIVTSKEGTDDYYKLLDKLDNVLEDYILTNDEGKEINTNEKRIYAPNIVSIVDGVVSKMTTGISDLQENAYQDLTDEIKNDSYEGIKSVLEDVLEEKEICSNNGKKC